MAFRIVRRVAELLDVLVASPADGEVLTYSSASGKWENQAGGGGGSQPVLAATVTLTHDQISALPTTRVELVAAPGAGRGILPIAAWLNADVSAARYPSASGGSLFIGTLTGEYPTLTSISNSGASDLNGLLNNDAHPISFAWMGIEDAGTQIVEHGGYTSAVAEGISASNFDNEPLVVGIYGVGDLTDGDPANLLRITVLYTAIDLLT